MRVPLPVPAWTQRAYTLSYNPVAQPKSVRKLPRVTTPKPILERLMDAIRASDLSYQELATKADVGKMTIAKLMSPKSTKRTLNIDTAEKIAVALNLKLDLTKK